jgi:hypothetical protein
MKQRKKNSFLKSVVNLIDFRFMIRSLMLRNANKLRLIVVMKKCIGISDIK